MDDLVLTYTDKDFSEVKNNDKITFDQYGSEYEQTDFQGEMNTEGENPCFTTSNVEATNPEAILTTGNKDVAILGEFEKKWKKISKLKENSKKNSILDTPGILNQRTPNSVSKLSEKKIKQKVNAIMDNNDFFTDKGKSNDMFINSECKVSRGDINENFGDFVKKKKKQLEKFRNFDLNNLKKDLSQSPQQSAKPTCAFSTNGLQESKKSFLRNSAKTPSSEDPYNFFLSKSGSYSPNECEYLNSYIDDKELSTRLPTKLSQVYKQITDGGLQNYSRKLKFMQTNPNTMILDTNFEKIASGVSDHLKSICVSLRRSRVPQTRLRSKSPKFNSQFKEVNNIISNKLKVHRIMLSNFKGADADNVHTTRGETESLTLREKSIEKLNSMYPLPEFSHNSKSRFVRRFDDITRHKRYLSVNYTSSKK